jgi:BlaI family transcriptional regulator, penicillinase repressor
MPRPTEPIPDAELQVLKLLWTSESLTARELAEAIYGAADNSTVGTVQKLLQRLEKKGCVKRDRSQFAHRFSAKVSQTTVAGRHLEMLAKKVADGSLAPFITHLVQARRLSAQEKEEIRRLLEE